MLLLPAYPATWAWTARLFTARGRAAADLLDQSDGVVGEQGVAAAAEFEVVAEVGLGLTGVHPGHGVAQRDPAGRGGRRFRA